MGGKSHYSEITFKPKQIRCLKAIYNGKDVTSVLPTGYVFPSQELSLKPVIVVVSPLKMFCNDQDLSLYHKPDNNLNAQANKNFWRMFRTRHFYCKHAFGPGGTQKLIITVTVTFSTLAPYPDVYNFLRDQPAPGSLLWEREILGLRLVVCV